MKSSNIEDLKEMEETFKILGDRTRIEILFSLIQGEKCVHEVAEEIDQELSNVSHHLRRLRDKELVEYKKKGRHKYYEIKDNYVSKILHEGMDHARE
ncbi:transcriptional regulator [archaeon SCG-AAA382B04]|nr:transcriptional regulator [archaeon SCG-AAA382B04]